MRPRPAVLVPIIGLGAVILAISCQSQPKPTAEPTPTENVVVVVITATNQPTLGPSETPEDTITPLATFTPIGLETPTWTPRPTLPPSKTPIPLNTPRPKTATATTVAATATVAPPSAYPAPAIIGPAAGSNYNDGNAITFQFQSVGPIPANVCYRVDVQMVNPNAGGAGVGDWWLSNCGDSSAGSKLSMALTKFPGQYTYSTIRDQAERLAETRVLTVRWSVMLVQDNGLGPDGVHHQVVPLGPSSQGGDLSFRL